MILNNMLFRTICIEKLKINSSRNDKSKIMINLDIERERKTETEQTVVSLANTKF